MYASGRMVFSFHELQIVCVWLAEETIQLFFYASSMKKPRTIHTLSSQICHVDQPLSSTEGSSPQDNGLQGR